MVSKPFALECIYAIRQLQRGRKFKETLDDVPSASLYSNQAQHQLQHSPKFKIEAAMNTKWLNYHAQQYHSNLSQCRLYPQKNKKIIRKYFGINRSNRVRVLLYGIKMRYHFIVVSFSFKITHSLSYTDAVQCSYLSWVDTGCRSSRQLAAAP